MGLIKKKKKPDQIKIALLGNTELVSNFKIGLDSVSGKAGSGIMNFDLDGTSLMILDSGGTELSKEQHKMLKKMDAFIYIGRVSPEIIDEIGNLRKEESINVSYHLGFREKPSDCVKEVITQVAQAKNDMQDSKQVKLNKKQASGKDNEESTNNLKDVGFFSQKGSDNGKQKVKKVKKVKNDKKYKKEDEGFFSRLRKGQI